jgi:hypothetical protein
MADEATLENSLKMVIESHRKSLNLVTRYDEDLSHMLGQMLEKYELSLCTTSKYDSATFSESIKNHIPVNFVFKAFPIQLKSRNVLSILESIKLNDVGKNVLESFGDQIRIGLRTKIVLYPEGIEAVWVILSAYYIDI